MFKKYVCVFLSACFLLLAACGGFVYAVDPFNHYRADKDKTKIIYQNPYYQNIGIAKYAQYDTLITGSSLTQNVRAWWFDDALGCDAVRLSFDGGYLPEYCELLRTATKYQKNLKTVYFGLDNYLITADSALAQAESKIPSYLTDDNPFTDVSYLLNRDVLFDKIRVYFAYKYSDTYDFYEMHAWGAVERDPKVFNKEKTLRTYKPKAQPDDVAPDAFLDEADAVYDALSGFVRDNPQTQFVFFAPPYSILYWLGLRAAGTLDATIDALRSVYTRLLQFDNVRLFFFQDDMQRITELDNYKDYSHYCTDYNRYMLGCFADGAHEISAENCGDVLDNMRRNVAAFDEDAFLSE